MPRKTYSDQNYDDVLRFISYYYQIALIKELKPKKILEVGIGNKTVSNYIKQHGLNIVTCDINKNLGPDFVGDIQSLPFDDSSFDVIAAYEILEHIPWKQVDEAFRELHRVTKEYVIISIPNALPYLELVLKFSLFKRIFKKNYLNIFFRIPFFSHLNKMKNSDHYWEIGRRDYNIRKIKKLIRKRFNITREIRPLLNSYHHFFVLKKCD